MKKIFIGMMLLASVAYAQDGVILQHEAVVVTVADVERYIEGNTPQQERESILKRKGIFKEIAENIYLVRRLAREAEGNTHIDWPQLKWETDFDKERKTMAEFLNRLVQQQIEGANWTNLAKEKYIAEGEEYQLPEKVGVSHILIKLEERTDESALGLINDIREKAISGEDFGMLAEQYSEDSSVEKNKGDLGLFGRGQMVKAFEDAAFSMNKPGEISEVVKSKFGYHILQFNQYMAAGKRPFEEAKAAIIKQLKEQRINQVRQDIIVAFRSELNLEWDDTQLEELRGKYVTPTTE